MIWQFEVGDGLAACRVAQDVVKDVVVESWVIIMTVEQTLALDKRGPTSVRHLVLATKERVSTRVRHCQMSASGSWKMGLGLG